jgi:hypothetical protein
MSQIVGTNIMMFAAAFACLSYVPYEYVAKGSLVFAILLFIFDPIPSVTQLLSYLLVITVYVTSKLHLQLIMNQEEIYHHQDENGITIVNNGSNIDAMNQSHNDETDGRSERVNADTTIKKDNLNRY